MFVPSQTSGLRRVMLAMLGGEPAGFACVSGVFYHYSMIMYSVKVASVLDLDGVLPQEIGSVTGMVCRLAGKVPQALVGTTSTRWKRRQQELTFQVVTGADVAAKEFDWCT